MAGKKTANGKKTKRKPWGHSLKAQNRILADQLKYAQAEVADLRGKYIGALERLMGTTGER